MVSSLSELSVNAVVNSFDALCFKTPYSSDGDDLLSSLDGDFCVLTLPAEVFLPPAVADTLLEAVLKQCVYRCPTHLLMWIYPFLDPRKCRLTRVILPRLRIGASSPSAKLLEFILNQLSQHNLLELSIDPSWCSLPSAATKILSGKNPKFSSLKTLNLRSVKVTPADGFASLANLHELRSLNLSQTRVGARDVNYLLQNMRSLEVLELAQTSVTLARLDLSPVAPSLRYLNVQDLNRFTPFPIRNLPLLQHLDISMYTHMAPTVSDELIDVIVSMPSLGSVDMSHTKVRYAQIEKLIGTKGSMLKFLGLLGSRYVDAPSVETSNIYPDHLTVRATS